MTDLSPAAQAVLAGVHQMTYDDLLPCPFCGSTNLRFEFAGSQGYIECNECGTEGPCDEQAADPHCDIEAAYDAWNRRPAALADGPAVPDGREPASVATQPSDHLTPVPISERLPGPEDCDAEGRCWFFHTSEIGGTEWFFNELPQVDAWFRWQSVTHWLSANALPLPAPEGGEVSCER